jgi:ABC-type transporter Mla subunit MlaD
MPGRTDADTHRASRPARIAGQPKNGSMEAATLNNQVSHVREELFSLIESVEMEARSADSSKSNAVLSELATALQDVANRLGLVESQCRDLD